MQTCVLFFQILAFDLNIKTEICVDEDVKIYHYRDKTWALEYEWISKVSAI